jgi:5-methylcytosine-specific restriction endonuclease McrA
VKGVEMAFPQSVVDQAWVDANGHCERCGLELLKGSRGSESKYGWEAHHKTAGGPDTLSNCEILCQRCHKKTRSYGG